MKSLSLLPLLGACLVLALSATVCRAESMVEVRFTPIFNGKDLTGWKVPTPNPFWRVENGVLVGENDEKLSGNYLWTEKSYRDFVLEFEVRWTGEVDTGIEFREPKIQMQLGVSRSLKRDMSGSFYVGKAGYPEAGQAKDAAKLMSPQGQWTTFRLQAIGPNFTVWINREKAVEYTNEGFPGSAPLGLQIHGGLKMKVEYRNLRAAEL
jgi:hypothetical protein